MLLAVPGTVWAVLVAQDQLHQSQEAETKSERAQASRVSIWAIQDAHGKWSLHLANRSPDPVTNVHLTFVAVDGRTKVVAGHPKLTWVGWSLSLTSVPPCTDMTITQDQLGYSEEMSAALASLHSFASPYLQGVPTKAGWRPVADHVAILESGGLQFTDRDGLTWVRRDGRLAQGASALQPLPGIQGGVKGMPSAHAVAQCEDADG
ncbi:hypothetical protein ACI2L1_12445 [Streptomyces sp. NPDC019531]|uniref:hypothetical protein n=1 Tax=Streptomyces sp. NPDC019531 TaxID=3365062 RepID=UPI00384CE389